MPRPKYVQAKRTTLKSGVSSSEATSIQLTNLVNSRGTALTMTDFGDIGYVTINPGTDKEEIVSFAGITAEDDGSYTLTTIVRDLLPESPYTAGGDPKEHAAGDVVVVSNNPQIYEGILDYIDDIAIAGAPDASDSIKGLVEMATQAEIDADTEEGSTGAKLAMGPDQLALSIYRTQLPSATEKAFITAIMASLVGTILPYAGLTAPTGFLLCDASAVSNNTYSALAAIIKGRYGFGTGTAFTADHTTETFTANSHGLSDGDIVFVENSGGALPTGLSANTVYYIVNKTTNTFQLSLTSGGSVVTISGNGTGTHSFYTTFKVPDLQDRFPLGYAASAPTKVLTFVSRSSNTITVSGSSNTNNHELQTGQAVLYSAPSGAMTGLTHNTTYYLIKVAYNQFQLASNVPNANEGVAISLSSDGTGTQTFTMTFSARAMGAMGGEENHALTNGEMPSHSHVRGTQGAYQSGAAGNIAETTGSGILTQASGSDTVHNNTPLFTVVNYIIKT